MFIDIRSIKDRKRRGTKVNKKKEEQQAANEAENKSALESESWVGILKARFFLFGVFFFNV